MALLKDKFSDQTKVKQVKKEIFTVTGLSCASCAASAESILRGQDGVQNVAVNYAASSAQIEYEPANTSPSVLQVSLRSAGYDLLIKKEEEDEQAINEVKNIKKLKVKVVASLVLSLPVFIIGMFFHHGFPFSNEIMFLFSVPVVFIFGKQFYMNAYKQARFKKANMDTLVALSTGTAFLFSVLNTFFPELLAERGLEPHVYFEAAVVIISFVLLGRLLEEKAKSGTSSAIKRLMELKPKTVCVVRDGVELQVEASEVLIDDEVLIKPGEKIPVDGQAISGNSFVDESMLNGEPVPLEKLPGSNLFAGTINQKGTLRMVAHKIGGQTVLAQIIQMVQLAQGSKAPVQKLTDKISGIFVPVVLIIAVLSFIGWMIFGGEHSLMHAMQAFITVLVIACPCALGLATPTAIMVGIGKGAENGILIKDAESLELAHRVKVLVLDKTGTITKGTPKVSNIFWAEAAIKNKSILSSVLHSLEVLSEHPLADAVVTILQEYKDTSFNITNFENVPGRGLKGIFRGDLYYIGNERFMLEQHIHLPKEIESYVKDLKFSGSTLVYFADKERVLSIIEIYDEIKGSSKEAVRQLQETGITICMLTGDNEKAAAEIASRVGINNFRAGQLPADKAGFIKRLQEEGNIVAMVGDGFNDSLALAQANVSIAMAKGADIALDVAKMTIVSSDLLKIPLAIKLSKQTVATIKQNLFFAFFYNLLGIPVAVGLLYPFTGFLLNPMIAGAAMAFSSLSVVLNSLRLKYR